MDKVFKVILLSLLILIYSTDVMYKREQLKRTKIEYIIKHDTVRIKCNHNNTKDTTIQISTINQTGGQTAIEINNVYN